MADKTYPVKALSSASAPRLVKGGPQRHPPGWPVTMTARAYGTGDALGAAPGAEPPPPPQTRLAKCESGELGQSGGFCAGSRGCPGLRPGENAAGGKGGGRESGTAGRGSYQNCGVCDFRRQIKLLPLPRAPSCAAETQPGPREYTEVSSEARQGSGQSCLVPDTPCWPTPPGTSDVDVARGPGVGTPLSELTSFPKVNTHLCMQSSPMSTWWMCALKCQNQ